ncbi:MAG: pyridoxal phosphate-dependent aminotransferase [Ktedonobacterales bacterium]
MAAPLGLTSATRALAPSATLRMNELVAARRAAGKQTIHLGFGEASFPLHPRLHAALLEGAHATSYPPVLGVPALRDAIAAYLARTRGLTVTAEQVGVAPGSKPLLYALMQVLEGDVLIPVPAWVSYAPQARMAGKRVILVATDPSDHLRLTAEALASAAAQARHAGAMPRILVVNSPSNPTGGMFAAADVAAVGAWARSQGVTIISDEIYAELAHGWRPHASPAQHYPEGTIVTGGLSKPFSAGGWRLGYAAVPQGPGGQKLLSAVRAVASEVWSGASGPIQAAAVAAFAPDEEIMRYVARSARLHGYVATRVHASLTEWGVICPRPAGAFYLYPDFEPWRGTLAARGVRTGAELARHLLDVWGVASLPASEFGEQPDALRLRVATSLLFEPDGVLSRPARDQVFWSLLEQADALPDAHTSGAGAAPHLPALERATQRLGEVIASLGPREGA